MKLPEIIQGGMGIAVSNWRLARAVAAKGQLGVVSGTAIDSVHARILQDGDPGGHLRSAYAKFPAPAVAAGVFNHWFQPEGRPADKPYRPIPVFNEKQNTALEALTALSCFAEVELARDNNPNALVGINLLDKIRIPQLPSLYGAMLAGVDYVLMGAGIASHVPAILDAFADGRPATLKFTVEGGGEGEVSFDPSEFLGAPAPKLRRPKFLAIITSEVLAKRVFAKIADGFVIETPIAGGHNAPPRGKDWQTNLSETGEPIYGDKDKTNYAAIAEIGKPFWIGGGYAEPAALDAAKALGAAGVQIGTAFVCCEESGLAPVLKRKLIELAKQRLIRVFTDPLASPTGFPFKVTKIPGSIVDPAVYAARPRVCDMGYLRSAYRRDDGGIGFRCASEPVENYVRKGGRAEDTPGRVCLCNSLMAACGYPQVRKKSANPADVLGDTLNSQHLTVEAAISTAGDTLCDVVRFLPAGVETYSAFDVLKHVAPALWAVPAIAPVTAPAAATLPESAAAVVEHAVEHAAHAVRDTVNTLVSDISETAAKAYANVTEATDKAYANVSDATAKARANINETAAKAYADISETAAKAYANVSETATKAYANVSNSAAHLADDLASALLPISRPA